MDTLSLTKEARIYYREKTISLTSSAEKLLTVSPHENIPQITTSPLLRPSASNSTEPYMIAMEHTNSTGCLWEIMDLFISATG